MALSKPVGLGRRLAIAGGLLVMRVNPLSFDYDNADLLGLMGILMLSEVLIAALSSWLFLHEALTLSQWAGVLVIFGTGVFVGLTKKAPKF